MSAIYIPPLPDVDKEDDPYPYEHEYTCTIRGVCLQDSYETDFYKMCSTATSNEILKKLNSKKFNIDNKIFYYCEQEIDDCFYDCEMRDEYRHFEIDRNYFNMIPILYSMVETRFRINVFMDMTTVKFTGGNKDICIAIHKFGKSCESD